MILAQLEKDELIFPMVEQDIKQPGPRPPHVRPKRQPSVRELVPLHEQECAQFIPDDDAPNAMRLITDNSLASGSADMPIDEGVGLPSGSVEEPPYEGLPPGSADAAASSSDVRDS